MVIESLRAQIRLGAEYDRADVDALCTRAVGLTLDAITTQEQAFEVLRLQSTERPEPERDDTPRGFCFQCGARVSDNSVECRPCHEGITPVQIEREIFANRLRISPLVGERTMRRLMAKGVQ